MPCHISCRNRSARGAAATTRGRRNPLNTRNARSRKPVESGRIGLGDRRSGVQISPARQTMCRSGFLRYSRIRSLWSAQVPTPASMPPETSRRRHALSLSPRWIRSGQYVWRSFMKTASLGGARWRSVGSSLSVALTDLPRNGPNGPGMSERGVTL